MCRIFMTIPFEVKLDGMKSCKDPKAFRYTSKVLIFKLITSKKRNNIQYDS